MTTKIEAMLALAMTNNLPAIWKSKVTGNDLAAEVGELSEFDRRNVDTFDMYRAGNGKVRSFHAVNALTQLAIKAKRRSTLVRSQILESVGVAVNAEPADLTPSLRANALGAQLKSHAVLQKQRQGLQILAQRFEALTGRSSRAISPEDQLTEIKELEAMFDKRSRVRRAA